MQREKGLHGRSLDDPEFISKKSAGRDSSTLLIYKIQNILDWIDQFLKHGIVDCVKI